MSLFLSVYCSVVISLTMFRGHQSTDGVLRDYCDGEGYRTNRFFNADSTRLQIVLYYDVEFTNPLGSHRNKHKQGNYCNVLLLRCAQHAYVNAPPIKGLFYFMLGNLHPKHRSKYKSVHITAICNRKVIQKCSMNAVIQPIIDDIKN